MENEVRKELISNAKAWFAVLQDAIEIYLCGMDEIIEEHYLSYDLRNNVVNWIFGQQDFQFCFDEVWLMFFDQDPEMVKREMKKRFETKYKNYAKENGDAEIESIDRRKEETFSGNCAKYGRNPKGCWRDERIENIVFA